ncbi:protein MKS1-like [Amborella trichopoda]|uniref:VQ domain-containing protein n=1 Tax=Amborella trichopoda TaxID=13333 RepID=U5D2R3_AMBTC|nr:protein MKS1-like [Amborella trichopoda]ERN16719.1 hypothetical protein AMTR_s00183p00034990 [Amborella trichopoda]|eukprot:XP_020529684.1 protein MKS1-like [Amborella trichopoda]
MKVQSKKTHKGKPGPKISKDCSGIRKPEKKQQVIPEERSRPPIIIYTQTPEIIHIEAQDFMSLVQRLTGKESGSVSSSDMISSSSSLSGSGSGSVVKLSDGAGTDSESPAFLYQPSVLGAFSECLKATKSDDLFSFYDSLVDGGEDLFSLLSYHE